MASIPALLEQALRAASVPILDVSLGDLSDRATWRVRFLPGVTPQQIATAQTIVTTLVVDAATLQDVDATDAIDQKDLTAAIRALWEAVPAPSKTLAQVRARAIAIRKTL
jgi:hypothetical protein